MSTALTIPYGEMFRLKGDVYGRYSAASMQAPAHGVNAGALYVREGEAYAGKIKGGRFFASREASPAVLPRLLAVAADPLGEATLYGKETGRCGCCGRELTDPESIAAGIGPICASKWGL